MANLITKAVLAALRQKFKASKKPLFCLDYDGTLVHFTLDIEEAKPSTLLFNQLDELARRAVEIAIVTGRGKEQVERWFGHKEYHLIAEHGTWIKQKGHSWQAMDNISSNWKSDFLRIFQEYLEKVEGSELENKHSCLSWHHRKSKFEEVKSDIFELKERLSKLTSQRDDLILMEGKQTFEVKYSSVDKGKTSLQLKNNIAADWVLAAGDDVTDEPMLAAFRDSGITIKISESENVDTAAEYQLRNSDEQLEFMDMLTR